MPITPASWAHLSPRARAELIELQDQLDATQGTAVDASSTANSAAAGVNELAAQSWQPASQLLQAISEIDDADTGAILIQGTGEVSVLPLDSISVFLGIGTTALRPTPDFPGLYFDTTLAAAGKPIWWTGSDWVDATGTVV
jgi:hypothetical protein